MQTAAVRQPELRIPVEIVPQGRRNRLQSIERWTPSLDILTAIEAFQDAHDSKPQLVAANLKHTSALTLRIDSFSPEMFVIEETQRPSAATTTGLRGKVPTIVFTGVHNMIVSFVPLSKRSSIVCVQQLACRI